MHNEIAQTFWLHDFQRYGKDDLGLPKNKLSKLLLSGTVSLMLSQKANRFDFRTIMDEGSILLIDLSSIGSQIRDTLGCFILSMLHLTALSRSDIAPEQRSPFQIYCDEAHRFITDALEDLIAETRKYSVGLTLAQQYMSQFRFRHNDAIASVGTTIIFNVDQKDDHHLTKGLRNKLQTEAIDND